MTETKAEYAVKQELQPEDVNLSELARDLLYWEKQKRQLDALEDEIKRRVLVLGETQTVGYVRATFSNPRKSYDYESPVQDLLCCVETSDEHREQLEAIIADNTRQVVDWRGVCRLATVDPIVTPGEGPGSVSIKLLN